MNELSRRNMLKLLTAGGAATMARAADVAAVSAQSPPQASAARATTTTINLEPAELAERFNSQRAPRSLGSVADDRSSRMQWWHDARFGMFIHRAFAGETRRVTSKDTVGVRVRGRGGFVIRFAQP